MEATEVNRETNEEFLLRVMNYGCPTGVLIQAFVVEALTAYSNMVVSVGPDGVGNALISGQAWVDTAQWLKQELDAKYGK